MLLYHRIHRLGFWWCTDWQTPVIHHTGEQRSSLPSRSLLFTYLTSCTLTNSPGMNAPSALLGPIAVILPCPEAPGQHSPPQPGAATDHPQRCQTAPSRGWTPRQDSQELCGRIRQLHLSLLFLSAVFLFQYPTAIFMASIDSPSEGSRALCRSGSFITRHTMRNAECANKRLRSQEVTQRSWKRICSYPGCTLNTQLNFGRQLHHHNMLTVPVTLLLAWCTAII